MCGSEPTYGPWKMAGSVPAPRPRHQGESLMNPQSTPKRNAAQPPPYGWIVVDGVWRRRHINRAGYFYFNRNNKQVFEHVWLWEQWNNRTLPSDCVCHHRDLNPSNNSRGNLECMTKFAHNSLHHLKWTGPCAVEACTEKAKCKGYCDRHRHQMFPHKDKDTPEFKARAKERSKAWALAHPERQRASQAKYCAAHPERRREIEAKSRTAHREERNARRVAARADAKAAHCVPTYDVNGQLVLPLNPQNVATKRAGVR